MKTENIVNSTTIIATAVLVKNRFIGFGGTYPSANGKSLGISEDVAAAIGDECPVITHGIKLVEAAGVITAGDAVTTDASGKAVTVSSVTVTPPAGATPVTSSGAQPSLTVAGGKLPVAINGYALDDAAADGDLIRVILV